MTNDEPIYCYDRAGFRLWVYRNRIEIVEGIDTRLKKATRTTISAKQIEGVDLGGIVPKLTIKTAARSYTYQLGTDGDAARAAIVQLL